MKIYFGIRLESSDKERVAKLAAVYDHTTAKMARICLLKGLEVMEKGRRDSGENL